MSESIYEIAEKRAEEKISFLKHLYSYLTVNFILFLVNFLTSPNDWWFLWVALFWGIGLIAHFLRVYVIDEKVLGGYREKMVEKEMENIRKKY